MRMISAVLACGLMLVAGSRALAAEPVGEWLVADKVAQVKIEKCDDALWGVISWEKRPGGRDAENPDPAKRNRPTLGMPILLNMVAAPRKAGRWEGQVYNAQNGQTYQASITLQGPDTLRIEGCVLGFLCGGENWTRVPEEPAPIAKPPAKATTGKTSPAAPPPRPVIDVCSIVADPTRPPHQNRLK